MATKTIGIKYERSPLDETLFFFVYHGYDPDQVISIIVTVRLLADTLASDARIGAVHVQAETSSLEGKSAVDFVVPFSGTIEQVEPIF